MKTYSFVGLWKRKTEDRWQSAAHLFKSLTKSYTNISKKKKKKVICIAVLKTKLQSEHKTDLEIQNTEIKSTK